MDNFSKLDFLHSRDKKKEAEEASLKRTFKQGREKMDLPGKSRHVLRPFEDVLSKRVWE